MTFNPKNIIPIIKLDGGNMFWVCNIVSGTGGLQKVSEIMKEDYLNILQKNLKSSVRRLNPIKNLWIRLKTRLCQKAN